MNIDKKYYASLDVANGINKSGNILSTDSTNSIVISFTPKTTIANIWYRYYIIQSRKNKISKISKIIK